MAKGFSLKGFLLLLCELLNLTFVFVKCHSDNIILDVRVNCSHLKDDGIARLSVLSDAKIKAKLYCQNENFTYLMGKHQISLNVPLTKERSRVCQLQYMPRKRTYEVVLTVYRIIRKTEELANTYKVICDEDSATNGLVTIEVNNPFQSPEIIEHFYNEDLFVNMNLEVRNIYGKKVNNLTVYRKVQLYVDVPLNYTGIQARECVMQTNEELSILKGGCGTGCIFNKDVGFTTNGTSVMSAYFLVPIITTPTATFSCKFRVCSTDCNGNSCATYKNKM